MIKFKFWLGRLSALAVLTSSAFAGPCTSKIEAAQAEVDARIEAVAKAGPYGTESRDARLHHQPTPRSIAEAEQALGEGDRMDKAVAALAEARDADAAGNATACEHALAKVRSLLGNE